MNAGMHVSIFDVIDHDPNLRFPIRTRHRAGNCSSTGTTVCEVCGDTFCYSVGENIILLKNTRSG